MPKLEQIARTIADLTTPSMKPAELFKAVRKVHPDASKKDIRSAAFYSLILIADSNPLKVSELHDLALKARADTGLDEV